MRPLRAEVERMTAAVEVLGHALLEIAEQGRATPCQGRRRDRWTSDRAEDRAWAATVCVGLNCEVLAECGAAADEQGELFGTWAGRDRTPPHPSRNRSGVGHPRQPRPEARLMPNDLSAPSTPKENC